MKHQDARSVTDEAYERYVTTKIGDVVQSNEESLRRFAETYAQYLRGWLPPAKTATIVDVGCGHGNMLYALRRWGYSNVAGLDRSSEQVALARQRYPEVMQGDAIEHLRAHENGYDLIMAIDLFEHFTPDQGRQFLEVCRTALRDRGRLILQLPNAGALRGGEPAWGDITHCRAYSAPAVQQFLKLCGFTAIEFRETGPVKNSARGLLRLVLWRFICSCVRAYDLIEMGRPAPVLTRTMLVSALKG